MKLTDVLLSRKQVKDSKPESQDSNDGWSERVQSIPIRLLSPGEYQPRQEFEAEKLAELAESIKVHGLLQPIVVRRGPVGYEVIVGERRLKACASLGWEMVPAIVRDVEDREAAELALIENLQRADLNIFEIAEGYERLLNEFELTQEKLAARLGISQANVANKIRLLRLPAEIRKVISREMLSERHARALLRLDNLEQQKQVLDKICAENLSVKQTEDLVKGIIEAKTKPKEKERKRGKRKLVIKDLRLFTNSLRDLTETLKSSGLEVDLDEREDDEVFEIVVTVKKPQGGGEVG